MAIHLFNRYPGKVAAVSSAYPFGEPRNVTVSGDGTGTPWEADWIKDKEGFFQSLLSLPGLTPTGTADSVTASQYIEGLQYVSGVPGFRVEHFLNVDPATLGIRILNLEGQTVLISNYQDLVDNTYVGDANNASADYFYKSSDSGGTTRSTTGAYFTLPDARGYFWRGLDTSGTIDPDGASRFVGDVQDFEFLNHQHDVVNQFTGDKLDQATSFQSGSSGQVCAGNPTPSAAVYMATVINYPTANLGNDEIRPVNLTCKYGVWY